MRATWNSHTLLIHKLFVVDLDSICGPVLLACQFIQRTFCQAHYLLVETFLFLYSPAPIVVKLVFPDLSYVIFEEMLEPALGRGVFLRLLKYGGSQ